MLKVACAAIDFLFKGSLLLFFNIKMNNICPISAPFKRKGMPISYAERTVFPKGYPSPIGFCIDQLLGSKYVGGKRTAHNVLRDICCVFSTDVRVS